ncbi:UbiA prenyltransferase family protein [Thermoplasmatales archaeon SCGC AB-540-F20]|nr:UbiA prenyltransferase family protein [Thermoplasmatales archaeon SCGC AB-540-F20]
MSFNIYGGIVLFSISILIFMLYNIYGKYLKGKDILLSLGVFFLALMAPGLLITSFNQLLPAVLLSLYFMLEFVVTTDLGDIKDVEVETRLKSKTPPVVFGVRVKDNKITYPIRFKAYVYSLRILMVAVLAIFIIQQNIGIESIGIVFIVLFVIISIGSLAIITKLFGDNVFDRRKLLVRIGINELMTFNAVPLVVLAVLDVEAVSRLVILAIIVLAPMIWLKLFLRVSYKDIVPIT